MKKNLTQALLVCLVLCQSGILFSQKNKLGEFKLEEIMTQDADAGGKSKMQSIKEAVEWRRMLLADENGNCFPTYQLNAIKRADEMKNNNSLRSSNPTLQWEELGPGNVGGRTRSILYDNRDPNRMTIYAGAVGGGIWKSTDGGEHWTQNTTVNSCLAVSCIAQASNGTIYFGTGEGLSQPFGTSRNSGQIGNGLHTLINDQDAILPSTVPSAIANDVPWCMINRIAINPTDTSDIYVAMTSYGNNGGLMHSTDGGQTWAQIGSGANQIPGLSGLGYVNAADVKFSSDGSHIFASVGNSNYWMGINLIVSQDGGQTWSYVSSASFPQYPSSVARIEIGVAPSDPLTAYIVVANGNGGLGGIYHTGDGGQNWDNIGGPGGVLTSPFGSDGQGWYDNVISVSPFDADKVYFGGTQLFSYSTQTNWNVASIYFGSPNDAQWVHADMHAIVFNDKNKDEMFIGCDGGIFKSSDAFTDFPNPNYTVKNRNYNVTENYSVAADYYGAVLGGAQDNGTNYVSYLNGAITFGANVYGGDGPYAEISHFNPNYFIGGYVGGNDYRSSTQGAAWVDPFDGVIDPQGQTAPSICNLGSGANAPFVTSFWLDESKIAYNSVDSVVFIDTITHYAGEVLTFTSHILQPFTVTLTDSIPANDSVKFVDPLISRLYFATYCGLWMTPDIINFTTTPRWFRLTAGSDDVKSLTATPTGDTIYFGANATISRMTGLNSVLAFDTSSVGHKAILLNTGSRFRDTILTILGPGRYIEGIDVDMNDPTHVIFAVAGYSTSPGEAHVYVSTNSGNSWTPIGGSTASVPLPDMPVYQCVIDAYNSQHYIIGSELGVWDTYDGGNTWQEQNAGINSRVPVFRLRQQTYLSDQCYALYIGTHGRGMWRCNTLTSSSPYGCAVNPLGVTDPNISINDLLVYPNPVRGASSKVRIELAKPSDVTIRIIDMPGRLLQETTYHDLASGKNEMSLNTTNLSNGTYLVVGTLPNGQNMVRTMVVAK